MLHSHKALISMTVLGQLSRGPDLGERRLRRIGDHCERRDDLLLDVSFWLRRGRVEELKQALDDRVQIRDERVAVNAFAEVDQRRGGVRVDAASQSSQHHRE